MNDNPEEWRKIPTFPTYEASDLGRIRHGEKVLIPVTTAYGYQQCTICFEGKRFTRFIHRLVADAFLPPRPSPKHQTAHNDGTRSNNTPSNLRWCTAKENNADKVIHGTWQGGENHAQAKLCDSKIKEIRHLHENGVDQLSLSRRFGIGRRTVNGIVRRQSWKHVA